MLALDTRFSQCADQTTPRRPRKQGYLSAPSAVGATFECLVKRADLWQPRAVREHSVCGVRHCGPSKDDAFFFFFFCTFANKHFEPFNRVAAMSKLKPRRNGNPASVSTSFFFFFS